MTRHILKSLLLCTAGVSLAGNAAFAQVPSSVEPGVVIQERGEEREEPVRPEAIITLPDTEIGPEVSAEKIFELQGVVLEGSKVYTEKDLKPLYQEFLGQKVSFADLNTIARRITIKYREDGYIFSRAVLPPQKIKGGIVKLQAVEGKITDVKIVGEYEDYYDFINRMAERIKSAGPSNTEELERYLLLIDDLPGVTARSVLQPSDVPGGGTLIITIETDPFEGSLSLDNRGSRFLGRHQATGVAAFNNLFNVFDRTTLRWLNTVFANQTNELRFFDITHEQQIGLDGIRFLGRAAVTSTEPGGRIENLDIDGNSQLYEANLLYPLIRSRDFNINLEGGFRTLSSDTKIAGVVNSRDRVRSIWAGTRFDFLDPFAGINQIDMQLVQGLGIFNATDDGAGRTRSNGEHDFTRAEATVTRVQDLPGEWSALFSASGQYSGDPLLASEEFTIGGARFGRAYDSAEIIGDHGATGVVEVRYDGPDISEYVRTYQFYGFYDVGAVWNRGDTATTGESDKESLASAGLGVRFNLESDYSGYLELNAPLTRDVNSEGSSGSEEARVFFSILKRF